MNFLLFVMKFVLVSPTFILSCIDTGNLREVCKIKIKWSNVTDSYIIMVGWAVSKIMSFCNTKSLLVLNNQCLLTTSVFHHR